MAVVPSLRERQAPLKERYQRDPDSAKLTLTVRSVTEGNDPMRSRIATGPPGDAAPVAFDSGAHPYAGGEGELACSGDLLLTALAACQEITIRMVAAAMNIELTKLELTVEGDLDFRGTMGVDPDVPVGFERIRTRVALEADAPADRLERLVQRAERYCVVNATLRQPPELTTTFETASTGASSAQ
jgi:uncharacterized OsmC-like protein